MLYCSVLCQCPPLRIFFNSYPQGCIKTMGGKMNHWAHSCDFGILGPRDFDLFFHAPIFLPSLAFYTFSFIKHFFKGIIISVT